MAKSVAQLTEQLQRIQRQLDAAKQKEVAGVIARIQAAIAHYGLTPEQLFAPTARRAEPRPSRTTARAQPRNSSKPIGKSVKPKASGKKLPAKFADGSGNSWTGRGSTPRWLAEAIAAGKTKEEFAVKV
jgi:DNA-binding protein H-NS